MSNLYSLIEAAFDRQAFEEAMIERISNHIDYDEVADQVLENYSDKITEVAAEVADDYI